MKGKMIMKLKAIILDFDGFLVDSNEIKKQACFNIFKGIRGSGKAIQEILDDLRGNDRFQFIKRVLERLGRDSSELEVRRFAELYAQITEKGQIEADEIKDAGEVLSKLKERGFKLILHTSTSDESIKRVIRERNMLACFDKIYGSSLGNKTNVLRIILQENNLSPENVLSVGDGDSELEAAEELGIKFIGLPNKFNDFATKERDGLSYVLHKGLLELLDIVGEKKGKHSENPTTWVAESPVSVGWMRQFDYFLRLYGLYKRIEGDVVECGVGAGDTFSMLSYIIGCENEELSRTLWGFDSFEGWPEPTKWDESPRNPQRGDWAISKSVTLNRLERAKISNEFANLKIQLVEGFFNKTLPEALVKKIAFLHIDADLYEGYRDALKYLFPKVAIGGVVAFDEFKRFPPRALYDFGETEKWPGCTRAVEEFFARRPEEILHDEETGKYYVVKTQD